jgi:hypothetical protein
MSVINRTLVVNPVEPVAFSMKLPTGLDTKIVIEYLRQNGAAYTTDLGGQLYLTSRSSGRVAQYFLPSIDVINGKARAYIPAGDIVDLNGYNVQIIGTIDGEPRLIAKGSASVVQTEALGLIPADYIDTVDLSFEYDEDVDLDVTVWKDATKDAPYDLSDEATTLSAYILDNKGGSVISVFTVTVLDEHKVRISLTKEQVNNLPATCWWTLNASTAAGLITLCEGDVTVTGVKVPDLVTTVLNYDYLKPDDADPNPGEIVHGNFTRNILKVAKLDADTDDQTDLLKLVRTGDTISVGVTTWTVTDYFVESSSFFTFGVAPVQQAGVTGVNPVTFARP